MGQLRTKSSLAREEEFVREEVQRVFAQAAEEDAARMQKTIYAAHEAERTARQKNNMKHKLKGSTEREKELSFIPDEQGLSPYDFLFRKEFSKHVRILANTPLTTMQVLSKEQEKERLGLQTSYPKPKPNWWRERVNSDSDIPPYQRATNTTTIRRRSNTL